jgi:glycosyltransferase involved in cell wall biosynthesis
MLSICIPAYTYVDYTAEAVRSILQQNADVELVVVEDFDFLPSDHPEHAHIAEVRDLLASDERIRWISANTRRPIQQNWNYTVAQATRTHVKVMGADDRLRPTGLQALLGFLKAEPHTQFLGHLGVIIDEQGEVVRRMRPYVETCEVIYLEQSQAVRLKLRQIARFREPACNVFAKRVWEQVGGYSEQFRFCFDVHFNTRVMAGAPSVLVSEEWCELRRHQGSDGANLPADLALDELERLVQFSLNLIESGGNQSDYQYGKAQVAYRVIELALARAGYSPAKALSFMVQQRKRLTISPNVWAKTISTLYRRLKYGDVQHTLKNNAAFSTLD